MLEFDGGVKLQVKLVKTGLKSDRETQQQLKPERKAHKLD